MKASITERAVLMAAILLIAGCHGRDGLPDDGGGLTVLSITTADVRGESTGLSPIATIDDVDPSSFLITFSEAIDETSASENVFFTCDLPEGSELAQPEIELSVDGDECVLTVQDAYKYQLMSCAITIGEDVASANVAAVKSTVGEILSYEFINGCAVSDDFNAVSEDCWTPYDLTAFDPSAYSTWPELLNILEFDPAGSSLIYDATALSEATMGDIYKTVILDPSGFEIELNLSDMSGFTSRGGGAMDEISLSLVDAIGGDNYIAVSIVGYGSNRTAIYGYVGSWSGGIDSSQTVLVSDLSDVGFKIKYDGSEATLQYDIGDGYRIMGSVAVPEDIASYELLGLYFSDASNQNIAYVDSVVTTGVTSETQY